MKINSEKPLYTVYSETSEHSSVYNPLKNICWITNYMYDENQLTWSPLDWLTYRVTSEYPNWSPLDTLTYRVTSEYPNWSPLDTLTYRVTSEYPSSLCSRGEREPLWLPIDTTGNVGDTGTMSISSISSSPDIIMQILFLWNKMMSS